MVCFYLLLYSAFHFIPHLQEIDYFDEDTSLGYFENYKLWKLKYRRVLVFVFVLSPFSFFENIYPHMKDLFRRFCKFDNVDIIPHPKNRDVVKYNNVDTLFLILSETFEFLEELIGKSLPLEYLALQLFTNGAGIDGAFGVSFFLHEWLLNAQGIPAFTPTALDVPFPVCLAFCRT